MKVPPELVKEWLAEFYGVPTAPGEITTGIANRAAQWGADQELEACCEQLDAEGWSGVARSLRAARRKPLSLKEQALAELDLMTQRAYARNFAGFQADTIRRALEAQSDG